MSVTEIRQGLGRWNLQLKPNTPRYLLDRILPFGHLVLIPGRMDATYLADSILTTARYVGVVRGRVRASEVSREVKRTFQFDGLGMDFWLGDDQDKGDIYETAVELTAATFAQSMAALLPPNGAVTAGVLNSLPGTYSGIHRYQTPRKALYYVADLFGAIVRVNGDGTLDAGTPAQLGYADTPGVLITPKQRGGRDLSLVAIPGNMSVEQTYEEYTTRTLLLAENTVGEADGPTTPYKDIHGGALRLTRIASESSTSDVNADARAELIMADFLDSRTGIRLSTKDYDIREDVRVYDNVYVYDPDVGFTDPENEIVWEGEVYRGPLVLNIAELTWPIRPDWTVAYRDADGNWLDLTDHYVPETGQTTVVVGPSPKGVKTAGTEPVWARTTPDTSTPAAVAFNLPLSSATYQVNINDVRATILANWDQPLNTDGSTIVDGSHYEIRYRVVTTYTYRTKWSSIQGSSWASAGTWGRPVSNDAADSEEWNIIHAPFDTTSYKITDLTAAANYELQIRAVDFATPPHNGDWSASTFVLTPNDLFGPPTPAPPLVAQGRLGIQIEHTLGVATGGTYNLPSDLDHLEVHVGAEFFSPNQGSLVGKALANSGMLLAEIPAIASFQVDLVDDFWVKVIAVDKFGNKSNPSAPVQSSISLIDDARISDLSVSKITAGRLEASIIIGGSIKTAESGQRVELNQYGIQAYDTDGDLTTNISSDPAETGTFIALGDNNSLRASISQAGLGAFEALNIATADVRIAGNRFYEDILYPYPLGIVARATINLGGVTTSSEIGLLELPFTFVEGRTYRVTVHPIMITTSATNVNYSLLLRDGGISAPTISSTSVIQWVGQGQTATGENTTPMLSRDWACATTGGQITPGLHRLLICMLNSGSGSLTVRNVTRNLVQMTIEDLGATISQSGVTNTGGGTPPSPIQNYDTKWGCTFSYGYRANGSKNGTGTDDAIQGQYDGTYGNQRGIIGFNTSSITSALAGATITGCWITLHFHHWYYNSGGTAVIGTHEYTSLPTTISSSSYTANRVQSDDWPKPGTRTISLGTTIGNEFKTGAARGILLGPGSNTTWTYYGRCKGASGGSLKPVLRITYQK